MYFLVNCWLKNACNIFAFVNHILWYVLHILLCEKCMKNYHFFDKILSCIAHKKKCLQRSKLLHNKIWESIVHSFNIFQRCYHLQLLWNKLNSWSWFFCVWYLCKLQTYIIILLCHFQLTQKCAVWILSKNCVVKHLNMIHNIISIMLW